MVYQLPANQPGGRPYQGGARIARFRGVSAPTDPHSPEDFIGSTTELHHEPGVGLTRLADGQTLRDAIRSDPIGFLGATHVDRFGADPMLLVKLLDTDERLFVHYHPDDTFAARVLGLPLGKSEAWVVLEAPDDGYATVGFSRLVTSAEVTEWVAAQDAAAMFGAMNRIPISAGDTLFVPAGHPHALGPGVLLVELQQPSDLSIILEYDAYASLDQRTAFLGLEISTALKGLHHDPLDVTGMVRRNATRSLLPEAANRYFRAERLLADCVLDAGFSILIVDSGAGEISATSGRTTVHAGSTVLIRHDDGPVQISGELTAIRCRPPAASR